LQDLVGIFDPFRVGGGAKGMIAWEDPLQDLVGMFDPFKVGGVKFLE
jgi:hypothetical protein